MSTECRSVLAVTCVYVYDGVMYVVGMGSMGESTVVQVMVTGDPP